MQLNTIFKALRKGFSMMITVQLTLGGLLFSYDILRNDGSTVHSMDPRQDYVIYYKSEIVLWSLIYII